MKRKHLVKNQNGSEIDLNKDEDVEIEERNKWLKMLKSNSQKIPEYTVEESEEEKEIKD